MTRQEQFERRVKNLLSQYPELTYEQVHASFEWAESFVRYKHLIDKEQ